MSAVVRFSLSLENAILGQASKLKTEIVRNNFHAGIVLTGGLSVMILFRFQIIPVSCERGLNLLVSTQ